MMHSNHKDVKDCKNCQLCLTAGLDSRQQHQQQISCVLTAFIPLADAVSV